MTISKAFLAILIACMAPVTAQAAVVISYTGTVDQFNFGPFTRGAAITGEIVLDTSVTPTEFGGTYSFSNVISSFSMTIAELTGPVTYTGSGGRVQQFIGASDTQFLQLGLGGNPGGTITGPLFNGFTPTAFGIDFRGDPDALFADPGVLATGLTELDFSRSFLTFNLDKPGAGVLEKLMVERRLDTVTFSGTASGVPGPAALALLGLGLIALGMRRGNQTETEI